MSCVRSASAAASSTGRLRSLRESGPYTRAMLSGGPGGYGDAAPRLLLVDDDPNQLIALSDQLRADG
jgi:hypothetical protein